MNPVVILLALQALRLVVAQTKTPADDKIVAGLDRAFQIIQLRAGRFDAWTALNLLLEAARSYAAETARTGDDKLAVEFQEVVTALEGVVGTDVYRTQLKTIVVDWPYMSAPAGRPVVGPTDQEL